LIDEFRVEISLWSHPIIYVYCLLLPASVCEQKKLRIAFFAAYYVAVELWVIYDFFEMLLDRRKVFFKRDEKLIYFSSAKTIFFTF
jgi:hypothetical protein